MRDPRAMMDSLTTHKQLQDQVIELAHLHGWRVAGFRTARQGKEDRYVTPVVADGKGFFDLVLMRRGTVLFVELKTVGDYLKPDQKKWNALAEMAAERNIGVYVRVWYPYDWPDIVFTLESF